MTALILVRRSSVLAVDNERFARRVAVRDDASDDESCETSSGRTTQLILEQFNAFECPADTSEVFGCRAVHRPRRIDRSRTRPHRHRADGVRRLALT
jgi:hypothetical protein